MNCRSAAAWIVLLGGLLGASATLAVDAAEALGSGRVVLVPPNLGIRAATEVEPGLEPVWREILSEFAARPQKATALERNSAAALWNEVMAEVRSQPDPNVYKAYALFARRIADQVDYSAIVFPSLVTRAARVQGETASWDGVRRHVELMRTETLNGVMGSDFMIASNGVRGEIAAASLHVAVLSPDGELRFEGAGGLSVLQELDKSADVSGDSKVTVALRPDAFGDASELREGVEAAFRRPLPASRAH